MRTLDAESPKSPMILRVAATRSIEPAALDQYGWMASVSKPPLAPAWYILVMKSRSGMQHTFWGSDIPAVTTSAPGSAALIRGYTALSIWAYWAGFTPAGQKRGMLGSFQTWKRRMGTLGMVGLRSQKVPFGP